MEKKLEDFLKEVKQTDEEKQPYDSNPIVTTCSKCGIEWRRVMYYSCSESNCPIQPKVTL